MNDQEFNDVIHKYRDIHASGLGICASAALLDSQYCKSLGRTLHQAERRWEKHSAVETLGASLPEQRGLYMFVWRPELRFRFERADEHPIWVLYIGKAGTEDGTHDTLRHRYVSEYSKYVGGDPTCLWKPAGADRRHDLLTRYLSLRPLEYWFLPISDVDDIPNYEQKLIQLLRPPVNTQHAGPRVRPGVPVPAF